MKRTMLVYALLLAVTSLSAKETQEQDKSEASHLYFTTEINLSGGNFKGWGKPDFGIGSYTLGIGYRFNDNWSIWIPVSGDFLLLNKQSTRNFLEQGTIGLGTGYSLDLKEHKAIRFSLNAGSTYMNSDINYLKVKAAVSFGFHNLKSSPYVSIGCTYFKPYSGLPDDIVLFETTIGFLIF